MGKTLIGAVAAATMMRLPPPWSPNVGSTCARLFTGVGVCLPVRLSLIIFYHDSLLGQMCPVVSLCFVRVQMGGEGRRTGAEREREKGGRKRREGDERREGTYKTTRQRPCLFFLSLEAHCTCSENACAFSQHARARPHANLAGSIARAHT